MTQMRAQGLLRIIQRIRLQRAMIVLCAILVTAYGGSAFVWLWRAQEQTLKNAAATLDSIARSTEIGTNRSIFEIDAMLLGIDRAVAELFPDVPLSDRGVTALLRRLNDHSLLVRDIMILDRTGSVVNRAGSPPTRPRNYAGRPFFAAHLPFGPARLYIEPPQPDSAIEGWSFFVSRPLMRNGAAVAIIAAEVPLTTLTGLFSAVVANSGSQVALLRNDGTLVASEPPRGDWIGRRPAFAPALLAAAATRDSGFLEGAAGEEPLLSTFRRIPARPLIVVVSRRRSQVLRDWRTDCLVAAAAFAVFVAMAGSLTWLMVRALGRREAALAELRAGEERLKQKTVLLQSTLENIGEGLSVFDRQGRLTAWNTRFVDLFDLSADLTTDTTLEDLMRLMASRGDFGPVVDPVLDARRRTETFYRELPAVREWITKAGRTLQIGRNAMPDGGIVTIYSDITERKAAELTMTEARAQAETANRSKSDFLANMSHELRTPLNAIIGFSEIIASEILGPISDKKYLEYIKDVHASGLHLLAIINDVLDMSKIEAGKLDLASEPVLVQRVVADSVRMLSERARSRDVELATTLLEGDIAVCGDERAIKQIVLNLLSNAVKFSHEGGRVDIRAGLDRNGGLVLEIEDYGIGMTGDEIERALQPFGQATAVATGGYGGTGLGLPICKGLIEALGGDLAIESSAGRGTLVRIRLPAQGEPENSAPAIVPLGGIDARSDRAVA